MKTFKILLSFVICALVAGPTPTSAPRDTTARTSLISGTVYNNLVLYTKYCAASYGTVCGRPMGNTLIARVRDDGTGTDGMVVRDDRRREIVVVFRGTSEITDALTDLRIFKVPLQSPGLFDVGGALVHEGFLDAYDSVALDLVQIIQAQVTTNPQYDIVVTGHSLGGAIASFAALSIRTSFPHISLKLYTFGQPRIGNGDFADYVERLIGVDNIFRAVHTFDGVVTLPPRFLGYEHFATEYWNFVDPPSSLTTRQCRGREDTLCSGIIPSTGINLPHTVYFGQVMLATPSVCS